MSSEYLLVINVFFLKKEKKSGTITIWWYIFSRKNWASLTGEKHHRQMLVQEKSLYCESNKLYYMLHVYEN